MPSEITLITCTGARAHAFGLCQRYMAAQTYTGSIQWIIVDDGEIPTTENVRMDERFQTLSVRPRPYWEAGQNTLGRNLLAAIPYVQHEYIFFIEDDDWYSPEYLQVYMDHFRNTAVEIVGEQHARYYNIPARQFRELENEYHSSLCQTAVRRTGMVNLQQICRTPSSEFIDIRLWEEMFYNRVLFYREYPLCIGIKGLPGREGIGIGHRPSPDSGWIHDKEMAKLRSWIGADVVNYQSQEQRVMAEENRTTEFETFVWKGQTRYKCPCFWESGVRCEFDTYDLGAMREHVRGPHSYEGKAAQVSKPRKVVSSILDPSGNQIEHMVEPEYEGAKFKDSRFK